MYTCSSHDTGMMDRMSLWVALWQSEQASDAHISQYNVVLAVIKYSLWYIIRVDVRNIHVYIYLHCATHRLPVIDCI